MHAQDCGCAMLPLRRLQHLYRTCNADLTRPFRWRWRLLVGHSDRLLTQPNRKPRPQIRVRNCLFTYRCHHRRPDGRQDRPRPFSNLSTKSKILQRWWWRRQQSRYRRRCCSRRTGPPRTHWRRFTVSATEKEKATGGGVQPEAECAKLCKRREEPLRHEQSDEHERLAVRPRGHDE